MVTIRRLGPGDEDALVAFYNGLSERSRRTFRPLGMTTTADACERIVVDNCPVIDEKFDLVALDGTRIVGWSFLWNLDTDEPLFGLGVADAYQGRGLGAQLMGRVMRAADERGLKRVSLTVVRDNVVAWRMYERRGFVRCSAFVGEDGLAYWRMVAELEGRRPSPPGPLSSPLISGGNRGGAWVRGSRRPSPPGPLFSPLISGGNRGGVWARGRRKKGER
jgi:ribosomal protein S18 acetylase RimI-like enzyme